jgi:hypothetical protein
MNFKDTFAFSKALQELDNTLVPFAQQNTDEDTGVPATASDMGFNGQIGNIEEPSDNRGVSGIQLRRSFYNIYFRQLTRTLPVLVDTMSSLFKLFIRDYCMNDRKYTDELKDYYKEGDVSYQEIEGRFQHNQLKGETWEPLTLLHDRGKTVMGYPSIWPGEDVPSWAIDIGSHDEYDWEDYPELDNELFKSFLTANADFGAEYDETSFTSPDLRGISPAVWTSGAGAFLASNAGQHGHVWGSTSVSTNSMSPSHDHTGSWSHEAHNHYCPPRTFSTGGHGRYSWSGKNKVQGTYAGTSWNGDHTHGVGVSAGTEKHWHGTNTYTPTVSTTPTENSGTVTRVNTYPVKLIVRVE